MSDAMECPESPEDLRKKLNSMLHEHVRVCKEGEKGFVRGVLTTVKADTWEVKGANNAYARFSLKNTVQICPNLIQITIKHQNAPE